MSDFNVYFTHPEVQDTMRGGTLAKQFKTERRPCIQKDGSLVVPTGANMIKWGYGLNTVTYPTYGGEVVQILSAYVTDLTVGGDVQGYYMMEDIYIWFLVYMNIATQGASSKGQPGKSSFNEEPVTMYYPHRGWTFSIRPKALPGLRMARDIVAPVWSMTASVVESDSEVEEITLKGAMDGLEEIQSGIGYKKDNPFSSPNGEKYDSEYVLEQNEGAGDWFNKIISSYTSGNFETTGFLASSPASKTTSGGSPDKVEEANP